MRKILKIFMPGTKRKGSAQSLKFDNCSSRNKEERLRVGVR